MAGRSKAATKRAKLPPLTPEEAAAIHRFFNEETTFYPSRLDTHLNDRDFPYRADLSVREP